MIVVCESTPTYGRLKPVYCPKCNRGKIGNIPEHSEAVVPRRIKQRNHNGSDYIEVKCPVCRSLWSLVTIN